MRTVILGAILLASQVAFAAPECVVMVHGMNRSSVAMSTLSSQLRSEGYYVVNETYPTHLYTIQQVARYYIPTYVRKCMEQRAEKIHFVTHSIGGLVVRAYLHKNEVPVGSRVVMLAPPNHGSILADLLHWSKIYQHFMGPMGEQLRTGDKGYSGELPEKFSVEIGVITGNSPINPVASRLLDGQNDGKVSVRSAKLAGMKEFLVVPSSHTFIMHAPNVIQATSTFLKLGTFKKKNRSPA